MKPKLDENLAEETLGLVRSGASNADLIAWLGVSESTFYTWLRDPKTDAQKKLSQGLKKAETERKIWHLNRIHEAARNGDWKASAWYLERRYPNEYARTQRVSGEITTTQKSDALTEAIKETVRRMEGSHE